MEDTFWQAFVYNGAVFVAVLAFMTLLVLLIEDFGLKGTLCLIAVIAVIGGGIALFTYFTM